MFVVFTVSNRFVSVVTVVTTAPFVSVSTALAPVGKPDMLKSAFVTPVRFTRLVIAVELPELIGTVTRTWPILNRIDCAFAGDASSNRENQTRAAMNLVAVNVRRFHSLS